MRLKRDVDRRIAKGLSVDERLRLNAVMADLAMKPTADVYLLKVGDPCDSPMILDCRGLPTATVAKAVEVSLDRLNAMLAADQATMTRYISLGSLLVAASSLVISFLTFRSKKNEGKPEPPPEEYGTA
jgi:hypothetical protein